MALEAWYSNSPEGNNVTNSKSSVNTDSRMKNRPSTWPCSCPYSCPCPAPDPPLHLLLSLPHPSPCPHPAPALPPPRPCPAPPSAPAPALRGDANRAGSNKNVSKHAVSPEFKVYKWQPYMKHYMCVFCGESGHLQVVSDVWWWWVCCGWLKSGSCTVSAKYVLYNRATPSLMNKLSLLVCQRVFKPQSMF